MNLSNLVHDNRHHSQPHARYSQRSQPTTALRSRAHQVYHQDMASALLHNPYTDQTSIKSSYSSSPKPPPSPPVEDPHSKCTLPSISSLIGMADNSASSTPTPHSGNYTPTIGQTVRLTFSQADSEPQHTLQQQQQQQQEQHLQQIGHEQMQDSRPYSYGQPGVSIPQALPPTPPLRPSSGFDDSHQSPSANSTHSSYSGSAINNVEPHQQRQPPPPSMEPYPMPRHPSQSPYTNSPYAPSPSSISNYSYPSPAHQSAAQGGMYYQRPLPSATYPPSDRPAVIAPSISNSHNPSPIDHTNPWQHHHYISPASSAAFAGQSQDRYICQTCNKAFSRPSSLRIHSHSHTGEKPFKCQHAGCGKAFSVRSNMKRHERGCHGGGSPGSS